jgi:hypothetical protein
MPAEAQPPSAAAERPAEYALADPKMKGELIADETEKWATVIRAANITMQ